MIENLRNIAIIAHVDHGKTTLVDKLLQQSGTFGERAEATERVMDSNDLEKERGITILAKNTAINWNGYRINIVDTPGHADFGGEVERVMSMVDSVLLVVDAMDGPMPQTRFVTKKAFANGLKPIVVINKVDRPGARPDWVVDQVFDLFVNLDATDEQLDFPIIYASALNGIAGVDHTDMAEDMTPLYQAIVDHVSAPQVELEAPFQMQISQLDYNNYLGVIGIGRIKRGKVKPNQQVTIIDSEGKTRNGKVGKVLGHLGLERIDSTLAEAGDIIAITGLGELNISDTICDTNAVEALPALSVDEPTVTMFFNVNTSPFCGKEGKYVTSRQILDRLNKELVHNVALRVEETDDADAFRVSGRGELHLSVLIENMRREGFELAVSRPKVIFREIDGRKQEPFENVTLDIEEQHQGSVMQAMGERKADLKNMDPDGKGRVHRVEQRVLQLRRHAGAVVFDVDTCRQAVAGTVQRNLKRGAGAQRDGAARLAQRLQRIAGDVQQHLFYLIRVMSHFRQTRIVVAHQRDVIRHFQGHQLADALRDLMNALGNMLAGPLRPEQTIHQITQPIGLLNDHLGVFGQRRIGQRFGQQLRCAAQAAQRVFNFVRQTAHQIAGCHLLGMLQLFLAQAALIVHRRQLDQDIAFRQRLSGQGKDMRAAVDHQGHFVVREALPGAQAFTHQRDVQRKITEQIGQRRAEQLAGALRQQLLCRRVGVVNRQRVIQQQDAVDE